MRKVLILAVFLAFSFVSFAQSLFETQSNGQPEDRSYDVRHYKISVEPDFLNRLVTAAAEITLVPLNSADTAIWFHASGLDFTSVTCGGKPVSFRTESGKVYLSFPQRLQKGKLLTIQFTYRMDHPEKGLYFRVPTVTTPYRRLQFWTQGEDRDSHFWFPCFDYPSDKATSEVLITVADSLKALSNGRLVEKVRNRKSGKTTWHWKQEKPHSVYLIMAAAGDYEIVKENAGKVPLEYWVYPDLKKEGVRGFSATPRILKFYEDYTGMTYPWEKYAQIVIQDFMFGGMENTTATTMQDESVNLTDADLLDGGSDALVAHELSHQWWGNVVTCKDFRHLWLNESFATYFETLYTERFKSQEDFETEIYDNQYAGIQSDRSQGRRPVFHPESFTANLYPRGASILHMLRFILGDEGFQQSLRHYLKKHQFQPVTTENLMTAIEEVTGQNLYWFFDEWIYKAGYPQFDISYSLDSASGLLSVRVQQTQVLDSLTGIFKTPFLLEIDQNSGRELHQLWTASPDTTYFFRGITNLKNIIFDKQNWILDQNSFRKPDSMWVYQFKTGETFSDWYDALTGLADTVYSREVQDVLLSAVKSHPYQNIRMEALNFLVLDKRMLTLDLIREAMKDTSSLVRAAAARQLSSVREKEEAFRLGKAWFSSDKSNRVQYILLDELINLKKLDALSWLKTRMATTPLHRDIKARILREAGENGVIQQDLPWLEGYSKAPNERQIREAALRAMKQLDPKNEKTLSAWLAVFTREDDELLVESLLPDAASLPVDRVVPVLQNLYSTTRFKPIKNLAKLELIQLGKSVF